MPIAALFQYSPSGKCLTKVPESPLSLTALWYCQGCGKAQLLLQTCQFLMWYPAAVGSCVLKLMLGFEFLYNLPQEGKAAKQSLRPPSPNLCSYIKQNFTLAVEVHYAIPYFFIIFCAKLHFGIWTLLPPACSTYVSLSVQSTLIFILCEDANHQNHVSVISVALEGRQLSEDWQYLCSPTPVKQQTECLSPTTSLDLMEMVLDHCSIFQRLLQTSPLISWLEMSDLLGQRAEMREWGRCN